MFCFSPQKQLIYLQYKNIYVQFIYNIAYHFYHVSNISSAPTHESNTSLIGHKKILTAVQVILTSYTEGIFIYVCITICIIVVFGERWFSTKHTWIICIYVYNWIIFSTMIELLKENIWSIYSIIKLQLSSISLIKHMLTHH